MSEMPNYLTENVSSKDLEQFDSQTVITVEGTVQEKVNEKRGFGSKVQKVELEDCENREIEITEKLGRNIINIEAWLHDHWLESTTVPEYIDLDENRTFRSDLRTAEVNVQLHIDEVIKASRVRAAEDSSHFLYVLGNWTYLADKNDHVHQQTSQKLRRAFERGKQNSFNPPGDANCEEFGGGKR